MSTNDNSHGSRESVLAAILSQENFWPAEPRSFAETGLPSSFVESLVCKRLHVVGLSSGRQLAKFFCLPFELIEDVLRKLRERQSVVHQGSAPLNDYTYALTDKGRERARAEMNACSYVGPAPVLLSDYIVSAEAQTIRAEAPKRKQLEAAFKDISVNRDIFETLGPAVNSGAGLFLYGEPGNGKTTLAKRIIRCFGQQVWIPHALIDDGQIIKLYDPALHQAAEDDQGSLVSKSSYDERWIRIRRPTVVVGGELTLDALEIRHDPVSNVSEAPLQLKANCGCFLIDDFGRQRVAVEELLNRWIVPLENRIDYLTLCTGKKIQVPFEQLIVFSTNLDPSDLVDEAFLRRIPYKIFVRDPGREEFHALFRYYARKVNCEYKPDVVDRLLAKHYFTANRKLRRCHPRDLLNQIRNYCVYNDIRIEMRDEYFDHVVYSYFADAIINDRPVTTQPTDTSTQSADPTTGVAATPPSSSPAQAKPKRPVQPANRMGTLVCDPREIKATANRIPPEPDSVATDNPRTASQAPPSQASPSQPSPSQVPPSQASPSQPSPSQASPSQASPSQPSPSQASPSQASPSQASPSQVPPSQPSAKARQAAPDNG